MNRVRRKAFQCNNITVGTVLYRFEFPPFDAPAETAAEQMARYCLVEAQTYKMSVTKEHMAGLVKEIIGNPFRPVAVDPAWLSSTAISIAQGIYDDKAFDRLPILADALQDSGCENADILDHMRSDGHHVRGCWALDLILGKS